MIKIARITAIKGGAATARSRPSAKGSSNKKAEINAFPFKVHNPGVKKVCLGFKSIEEFTAVLLEFISKVK